jgi:hypothetical protein
VSLALILSESAAVLVRGTNVFEAGGGYLPLHPWNNPTLTLLAPLALVYLPLLVRFVLDLERGSPSRDLTAAVVVLTVLTILAKPALQIGLLPGFAVFLAVRWWRDPPTTGRGRAVGRVAAAVLLPSLAVMAWQYWFLRERADLETRGGLIWSPFETADLWGAQHPEFWLVLAVPLFVAVVWRHQLRHDPEWLLSLVTLGFAILAFLLLAQTGRSRDAANVGHAAQIATVVVLFFSFRRVALEVTTAFLRRRPLVALGGGVLVALGLLSGVSSYLENLRFFEL